MITKWFIEHLQFWRKRKEYCPPLFSFKPALILHQSSTAPILHHSCTIFFHTQPASTISSHPLPLLHHQLPPSSKPTASAPIPNHPCSISSYSLQLPSRHHYHQFPSPITLSPLSPIPHNFTTSFNPLPSVRLSFSEGTVHTVYVFLRNYIGVFK